MIIVIVIFINVAFIFVCGWLYYLHGLIIKNVKDKIEYDDYINDLIIANYKDCFFAMSKLDERIKKLEVK